jgi:hypothetical protein
MGRARRYRCEPVVDCLDRKPPITAYAKRGQLISLEHPVNRGWMHPKVAGYVPYRQDLAIHFIESIHVVPLCYARLVGRPSLFTAVEEDKAHTAKLFSAGEGDRKGGVSAVWAIFSDIISNPQTFRR